MANVELVIKMSKRVYNYIRKYEHIANSDVLDIKDAIINGTPLPKGHGDLIDRNEAEKIADKMFEHITSPLLNHIQTYDAYNIIRLTPTVVIEAESEVEDAI